MGACSAGDNGGGILDDDGDAVFRSLVGARMLTSNF